MNLYLISQDGNNGYDTFDSAVVCAEDEEEAKRIHPYGYEWPWEGMETSCGVWTKSKYVIAVKIGRANDSLEKGVICASFNAG